MSGFNQHFQELTAKFKAMKDTELIYTALVTLMQHVDPRETHTEEHALGWELVHRRDSHTQTNINPKDES